MILATLLAALVSLPVDIQVPKAPAAVRGSDGLVHLIYELHITNFRAQPVELRGISINEVLTYNAEQLNSMMARPGAGAVADKRVIAGGMRAVVFLDFAARGDMPRQLVHRIEFADAVIERFIIAADTGPARTVDSPLRGDRWLAMHALSNASSHRRTIVVVNGKARIAQRFATDWTRIGPNGLAYHDDPANLSNWYAYGAEVFAVADGRVVETRDGMPENNPTSDTKAVPINIESAPGNYVLLDLGADRYALYAHLQPGSIRVHQGDKVRGRSVLAKLGNSGNSDAPHLHFHIADAPSPLAAEGTPYTLRRFDVLGSVPSLAMVAEGTGWKATGERSEHHDELPIENSVIDFR
jgi:hypothetical protein